MAHTKFRLKLAESGTFIKYHRLNVSYGCPKNTSLK